MERVFDAIAAGGGLAGAAFALELARSGANVAVLERTRGPQLKVCGDFLSIEAQRLLGHLGIEVRRLGAEPVKLLKLSDGHRSVEARLPFPGAGLSRLALDEALLNAAAEAGAEIIRGSSVSTLEPHDDLVAVHAGDRIFRAKAAALATGKHNLRGVQRRSASRTTAFKLMLQPRCAASLLAGRVQLFGFDHGFAGICPVEQGAIAVCWMVRGEARDFLTMDWRGQFARIAKGTPAFGDLLHLAEPLNQKPAAISATPYGFMRRAALAPNVFAIGDQLAVIPSFTGDGTSIALLSGIMAARALLAGETAAVFQNRFLGGISRQFLWARAVDFLFSTAPARKIGIRFASVVPGVVAPLARRTRLSAADTFA